MRQALRSWLIAGVSVGAVVAPPAAAQVALPSRQEVTPPTPEPRTESDVDVDASGATPQPTCPFDRSDLRVSITRIELTRADGSPLQPEIARALADVAPPSGEQPIGVVCTIRDEANAALRRGGWVASVQIPAQEIADGVLRLQVVTARITEIRVRGDAGRYEALLRQRLAAIQALDPLNEREAERLLLLTGDVPGLDVALSLRPSGGEPGTVIGDLTVASRRFALFANAQNFNSRLLGRETIYARGELYGLTGLGDLTYLGASTTADLREQVIVQGGHIFGVDVAGTGSTLGLRGTYAWSRPDLGALDLRTTTLIAGLDFVRPLIRSVRSNARARVGVDYIDQISRVGQGDDAVTLTRDKLRIAYVGLDADQQFIDINGRTWFSVAGSAELRKGFDLLDASDRGFGGGDLTSRLEGDSRALVARGTLEATMFLGPIFSLAALGQVQWADDPLLNYEEYALGSLTIGRGYDPGANSGDRAAGVRTEVRADIPGLPIVGAQLFGFYDHLYLRNLDRTRIEGARDFASVGGGVRVSLPNRLVLEVAYAKPLDRALVLDERKPPARVLVSLTAQLRDRAR